MSVKLGLDPKVVILIEGIWEKDVEKNILT